MLPVVEQDTVKNTLLQQSNYEIFGASDF